MTHFDDHQGWKLLYIVQEHYIVHTFMNFSKIQTTMQLHGQGLVHGGCFLLAGEQQYLQGNKYAVRP
jgi:hypothetical protein